ncbi:MAG: galactose-1-phosphate uridylyltransferase [Pirellulales bacterium]|nr:galactose-1-phosphate uridylyltransferase [Pirellulales bacterium]
MSLSELRFDPIVGRQVFVAEDRAGRPNDFVQWAKSDSSFPVADAAVAACPFCAGHEEQTAGPLLVVPDAHGNWQVRVIPNKYPAVTYEAAVPERSAQVPPLPPIQEAFGSHEVVIESPRHVYDATELSLNEFVCVLTVYRDRLAHWSADPHIQHVSLFKNVGYAAGASLEHAHSQLMALPFVPAGIKAKLRGARSYFAKHDACIFCHLLEQEVNAGVRWVAEEGPFVAFCAYAGRQPYETWILPTTHAAHYGELGDEDVVSLAKILQKILLCMRSRIPFLSYNLILHTAPFDHGGDLQDSPYFHWHWELVPRTNRLAGLEWGMGVHVNPVAPERAAAALRATAQEQSLEGMGPPA